MSDFSAFRDLFSRLKTEMQKAIVGYDDLLTETLLAIFSGGQHAGLALFVVSHTSCRRVKAQGTKGTGIFQKSGAPDPWGSGNSVERGQKKKDSLPEGSNAAPMLPGGDELSSLIFRCLTYQ